MGLSILELVVAATAGMVLAGFTIQLVLGYSARESLKQILKREAAIMAFLLKEYEEHETTGERLLEPDDPMVKVATRQLPTDQAPSLIPGNAKTLTFTDSAIPKAVKKAAPVMPEKEIARRKAFGEKMKENRRLAKEAKAAAK